MVLHLRAQGLEEGDKHPPTLSCGVWSTLPFYSVVTKARRASMQSVNLLVHKSICGRMPSRSDQLAHVFHEVYSKQTLQTL